MCCYILTICATRRHIDLSEGESPGAASADSGAETPASHLQPNDAASAGGRSASTTAQSAPAVGSVPTTAATSLPAFPGKADTGTSAAAAGFTDPVAKPLGSPPSPKWRRPSLGLLDVSAVAAVDLAAVAPASIPEVSSATAAFMPREPAALQPLGCRLARSKPCSSSSYAANSSGWPASASYVCPGRCVPCKRSMPYLDPPLQQHAPLVAFTPPLPRPCRLTCALPIFGCPRCVAGVAGCAGRTVRQQPERRPARAPGALRPDSHAAPAAARHRRCRCRCRCSSSSGRCCQPWRRLG